MVLGAVWARGLGGGGARCMTLGLSEARRRVGRAARGSTRLVLKGAWVVHLLHNCCAIGGRAVGGRAIGGRAIGGRNPEISRRVRPKRRPQTISSQQTEHFDVAQLSEPRVLLERPSRRAVRRDAQQGAQRGHSVSLGASLPRIYPEINSVSTAVVCVSSTVYLGMHMRLACGWGQNGLLTPYVYSM